MPKLIPLIIVCLFAGPARKNSSQTDLPSHEFHTCTVGANVPRPFFALKVKLDLRLG
jgi:hypothetical protein